MAKPKYPWKSTPLNGFFAVEMPNDRYARVVAAQRKKYGEQWSVHYDKKTKLATYTRLDYRLFRKYNWNLIPGTEQEFRFDNQIDAMKAMGKCHAQVRYQNRKHQTDNQLWLVAPMHDYLGFTLRRRQCWHPTYCVCMLSPHTMELTGNQRTASLSPRHAHSAIPLWFTGPMAIWTQAAQPVG